MSNLKMHMLKVGSRETYCGRIMLGHSTRNPADVTCQQCNRIMHARLKNLLMRFAKQIVREMRGMKLK